MCRISHYFAPHFPRPRFARPDWGGERYRDVTTVGDVEWRDLYYGMGTKRLWIVTAEILVKPGDLPSGDTKGFTNVVTWADSAKTAQQRVSEVLKSYEWEILGVEAVRPFDDSRSYDDDLLDIVDRARTNPNACIIGTFFGYKPE